MRYQTVVPLTAWTSQMNGLAPMETASSRDFQRSPSDLARFFIALAARHLIDTVGGNYLIGGRKR